MSTRTQMVQSVDFFQINGIHFMAVCFDDAVKLYNGIDHRVVQHLDKKPPKQVHICKLTGHLVVVSADSLLVYLCDRGNEKTSRFDHTQWIFSREIALFGHLSNAEISFSYPLCSFNFMGSVTVIDILSVKTASYLRDESNSGDVACSNSDDVKAFEMATLSPNSTYLSAMESDAEESEFNPRLKQNIFRLYIFFMPREVFVNDSDHVGAQDSGFMFFSNKHIAKSEYLTSPTPRKRSTSSSSPRESGKGTKEGKEEEDDDEPTNLIEHKLIRECLSTVLDMGKQRICCHSWRVANQYSQQLLSKRDKNKRVVPMLELFLTFDIVGCLKIWSVSLAEPTDSFLGSGSFNISRDGSMTLEVNLLSNLDMAASIPEFARFPCCAALSQVSWVLVPKTSSTTPSTTSSVGELSHSDSVDASRHVNQSNSRQQGEAESSDAAQIALYPVGWVVLSYPALCKSDGATTVATRSTTPPRTSVGSTDPSAHAVTRRPSANSHHDNISAKQKIRERDSAIESRVTVDATTLTGHYLNKIFKLEQAGQLISCGSGFEVNVAVPRNGSSIEADTGAPTVNSHKFDFSRTSPPKTLSPWNMLLNVFAVCRFQNFNRSSSTLGVPHKIDILLQFGDLDASQSHQLPLSCIQTQYAGRPNISTATSEFHLDGSARHDDKHNVKSPFYCSPVHRLLRAAKLKADFGNISRAPAAGAPHDPPDFKYQILGSRDLLTTLGKGLRVCDLIRICVDVLLVFQWVTVVVDWIVALWFHGTVQNKYSAFTMCRRE